MSTPEQIALKVFEQFDKDKSGTIDASEVKAMLTETYKGLNYTVTDKDVSDTLAFMDTNKDGLISKDEYINMVKKAFENKDK